MISLISSLEIEGKFSRIESKVSPYLIQSKISKITRIGDGCHQSYKFKAKIEGIGTLSTKIGGLKFSSIEKLEEARSIINTDLIDHIIS